MGEDCKSHFPNYRELVLKTASAHGVRLPDNTASKIRDSITSSPPTLADC